MFDRLDAAGGRLWPPLVASMLSPWLCPLLSGRTMVVLCIRNGVRGAMSRIETAATMVVVATRMVLSLVASGAASWH
ncbi:hypothetical protein M8C21_027065 [Ambrosia artemisiifolia]|uniref:Uncharacterized protein n=1 Tax=Ambrosia artemisiifolia TaxID=4212 RepID=A0AAD5C365_AMBAR|nr:hypothetical protein M8C21_027065 [Ambrosia artemisiifolia]